MNIENVSKDLIFQKAFELALAYSPAVTGKIPNGFFKNVMFFYNIMCVSLNIASNLNVEYIQAIHSGNISEFGEEIIPKE